MPFQGESTLTSFTPKTSRKRVHYIHGTVPVRYVQAVHTQLCRGTRAESIVFWTVFRRSPPISSLVVSTPSGFLIGCLGAHGCRPSSDHSEAAVQGGIVEEGAYCYLGYPPGTVSVSFRGLVDKLPALLSLIQAAHRVGEASTMIFMGRSQSMSRDALEIARNHRLRLAVDRAVATLAEALETVNQRMGESTWLELAALIPAVDH